MDKAQAQPLQTWAANFQQLQTWSANLQMMVTQLQYELKSSKENERQLLHENEQLKSAPPKKKARVHARLSCPAQTCGHTVGVNNRRYMAKHKKECSHFLKELNVYQKFESPVLSLRDSGMHPILEQYGFMKLENVFVHHMDDLALILKYSKKLFTQRYKSVTPDFIHTLDGSETILRIHLHLSTHSEMKIPDYLAGAILHDKHQTKELKRSVESVCVQAMTALGRKDYPNEIQLVCKKPGCPGQQMHMDAMNGVWESVIVGLERANRKSTKYLKYPFLAPGTTGWRNQVPLGNWDKLPSTQLDLGPADACAHCTSLVHAGDGNVTSTNQYSMFIAWKADDAAELSDTDAVVVTSKVFNEISRSQ